VGAIARALLAVRMSRRGDRDSFAAITAFQSQRLKELTTHAYENVPFYRRKFNAVGLEPRHIRGVGDLHLIPITSREELQQSPVADIVARGMNPRNLLLHKTSGTTGEPMVVRRTWLEERALGTLRALDLTAYGIRASDRIVSLVRGESEVRRRDRVILSASRATGRFTSEGVSFYLPPDELLNTLVRMKPDVIAGYASVLARLAEFISASGDCRLRPRVVISGAEILTPPMARLIENALGARLYDKYGSNEFGRIASQCPEGSQYHVCDTGVIAEALRDGQAVAPGDDGDMVGTALHSFAMPFIRYRLDDTINAGTTQCDCGRRAHTLRSIRGRSHEYFELPDGRRVHFYELRATFYDMSFRWMRHYRFDQDSPNRIVLRVVPSLPPAEHELEAIRERVRMIIGAGAHFGIELCDALPMTDDR